MRPADERIEEAATARSSIRRRVPLPVILRDGRHATTTVVSFSGLQDGREHIALIIEPPPGIARTPRAPRVRLHSECLTGDVFGSARCDCGPQLREAIESMAELGGIILYLRQEGRGIGLYNKLDAYSLQDAGYETFAANRAMSFSDDSRDYGIAAAMLEALEISHVELVTNNPDKAWQLARQGITVLAVIPTDVHVNDHNRAYLSAKRDRGGQYIQLPIDDRGHED